MGFIKLDRFGDPPDAAFDAAAVVERVRTAFPGVRVLSGDQLALSADRAAGNGAPEHIVRTLRRNQHEFGPAFAFEFDIQDGGTIRGTARRYDVTFLYADPLTQDWRKRLSTFLQSLGAGRIEEAPHPIGTHS